MPFPEIEHSENVVYVRNLLRFIQSGTIKCIATRHPLNGKPTISSLTKFFINTTPEITLSLEIVFMLWLGSPLLLSICNFHTTSLSPRKRILEIDNF
ncbi:hypothetical protein OUZ56_029257 [Daphnia magna]|uniref:Uncharacterized protein n=1 Tax=Daphnia magna TaxID=35525 RepID=A0ABR0B6R3_9CRUS|nr:hypothetical protein OUZ56_029257 [Daphnia magna]